MAHPLQLVDCHCHLEDETFDQDLDQVIERAKRAGLVAIVTSPIRPEHVEKALSIMERYKGLVYVSLGLEPTILDEKAVEEQMRRARELADRIVAIGEVGLDYYYVRDHALREKQVEFFRKWIRLAMELDLPLVVHSRSAGKYALKVVLEEGYTRVLMHAFDGRASYAVEAAREGILFSIPPSIAYAKQKQELAKRLPLESLVLETDAPVMAPVRGTRNEPANARVSAEKIAELKGVSLEEVAAATTRNARKFFHIKC